MSIQSPNLRQEEICQLLQRLVQTNPHFALWELCKRGMSEHSVACEWRQFLSEQLGPGSEEEIEFACAMMELDKLLAVYHDQNLALPVLSYQRILFLHLLRGPERMAQTRAILGTLTAELMACTSA
jgi:hypothetical protein